MEKIWSAEVLARWCKALTPDAIPDEVYAKAEDCVLDAIGCAIAGYSEKATSSVMAVALAQYRDGPADIWFSSDKRSPVGAALVNANAVSILDLDDGHRGACGHPGAAVVPEALAVAQETGASGIDFLTAVITGYEVCTRIGASENRIAFHTGNWTGFGAATAVAMLRGQQSIEQLANALSITAYHGPRVADLTLSADMGTNVKESIPWSVVTGMTAVELAANGFTGCRDALDIDERFKVGFAISDLGIDYQIMQTYYKRYSACRWIHSAVEGLLQVMKDHDLSAKAIDSVHVETFLQAASLNNLADPASPESAQYSIPYCLGITATKGEAALMPMSVSCLHDTAAINFANKVTVVCNEKLANCFPTMVPARLTIKSQSKEYQVFIETPWGEPGGPTNRTDLTNKFLTLADNRISSDRAISIVDAVINLRKNGISQLCELISGPMEA